MKRRVRIYVEGGATGKTADADFRRGWGTFLSELRDIAQANGYHTLTIVRGKGRSATFKDFRNHKTNFPEDLCVLLVDAETDAPPQVPVWDVVKNRKGDGWSRPSWATDRHLYLMTHFVETWLLTDHDALVRFFKRGFAAKYLPTTKLEERSKDDVEKALKKATKDCQRGCYRHGQAHEVIEKVAPEKVKTLFHGSRLFEEMDKLIRDIP